MKSTSEECKTVVVVRGKSQTEQIHNSRTAFVNVRLFGCLSFVILILSAMTTSHNKRICDVIITFWQRVLMDRTYNLNSMRVVLPILSSWLGAKQRCKNINRLQQGRYMHA